MKKLELEVDEGQHITAFFRPPTRDEIEKSKDMQRMGRTVPKDDPSAQQEFGIKFTEDMFTLGTAMLYRASGEMPAYATDCQTPQEVVLKYYSGQVARVAIESLADAIQAIMPAIKIEAAVVKN